MGADFVEAMCRMVPSTHRIQDQSQSPLVPRLRPLLTSVVGEICQKIDEVNKGHEFSYRPRILIRARPGQCVSTYIAPAILHHLEKLPCHKLDIPSLNSNSARSPEEAMFHIIQEAKRTVPSVLYIPHLLRLWRNVLSIPQREAFMALLSEIAPTAPLSIIAFTEERVEDDDEDIIDEMFDTDTEIVSIGSADPDQRREYFKPIFDVAKELPEEDAEGEGNQENQGRQEILAVLPIPESRELTEKEEKRLARQEDTLLRELRIFLRDTWQKINKEQRFFMFRTAVDTEEIYDYLEYVEKPMDFDQMLTKLDNGEYHCAQDFLDDIDLVADNAVKYNSDFDGEVSLNETMGLKMDFNKLKQIEDDLVTRTENSTTEILEKVYTKLMECVSHYKGLYDRTQLPKDLEDKMSNLLPQISTTPASTKRKVSTSSINSC